MWILRAAFAFLILATAGSAWAAKPPKATLDYSRQGRAAAECPDEATFRALVAAKLGYDPFGDGAASSLHVDFRGSGSDLSGTLTLTSGGAARGERTLRSAGESCDELAASLALAAAVALDPDSVANRGERVPTGTESGAPTATGSASSSAPPPTNPHRQEPVIPAAPDPQRSPRTFKLRLSAGLFVPWGLTPSVTAGARFGAGLDASQWLLGVEGGATLESSKDSAAGTVTARTFDAALVPCLRPALNGVIALGLCAVGRFTVVRSDATGVTRASPQTDLTGSIGPRLGVEVFPWQGLGFGADVEMPISLSRVHLLIDDHGQLREVWASSRVGMIAAASLIFRL